MKNQPIEALLQQAMSADRDARLTAEQQLDWLRVHFLKQATEETIQLMGSAHRNSQIMAYSYLKNIIRKEEKEIPGMLPKLEELFMSYRKGITLDVCLNYQFQFDNIVGCIVLYLSQSRVSRQNLINFITTKAALFNVYQLDYYSKILVSLKFAGFNSPVNRNRILLAAIIKQPTQSPEETKIRAEFILAFSIFTCWFISKDDLIYSISKYTFRKKTFICCVHFLLQNHTMFTHVQCYEIFLALKDKILQYNLQTAEPQELEIILRGMKMFLECLIKSPPNPTTVQYAIIIESVRSQHFWGNILEVLMKIMKFKKQDSTVLKDVAIQLIRLCAESLPEQSVNNFMLKFSQPYLNCDSPQNRIELLYLLTGMPRFILSWFQIQKLLLSIIQVPPKESIVFHFISHYLTVYEYIELDIFRQIAIYLKGSIDLFLQQWDSKSDTTSSNMALSLQCFVKLQKFKEYVKQYPQFYQFLCTQLLSLLCQGSSDDFSELLIQAMTQLISRRTASGTLHTMILEFFGKVENSQVRLALIRALRATFQVQLFSNATIHICNNFLGNNESLDEEIISLISQILLKVNICTKSPAQVLKSMINAVMGEPLQHRFLKSILKCSLREQPYEFENQMSQDQRYFQIECGRLLMELALHHQYIKFIQQVLEGCDNSYVNCIWEVLIVLYPEYTMIAPSHIRARIEELIGEHLKEMMENMNLNDGEETPFFQNQNQNQNQPREPQWREIYSTLVRAESAVHGQYSKRLRELKD